MYAKYFGTNIVIYLPNTVPTTTTISLWKTKVQYLEVKDAVEVHPIGILKLKLLCLRVEVHPIS